MTYALYLDPTKKANAPELPKGKPELAYCRLIDCDEAQLESFNNDNFPDADFTVVEIHPAQLDRLRHPLDRLSIVQQKSAFRDLGNLRQLLAHTQCDVTLVWDKRFTVDYYIKMLRFWLQCGVQHFSFYELSDFEKWQRLQKFMNDSGFYFYDRYHACKPGFESPYQKHVARYGDMIGWGGGAASPRTA